MFNLMAYIDPGSTALIWQILAGAFVTFGVVLGIWWTKITTFFRGIWVKIFGKKGNSKDGSVLTDVSKEIDEELL